MKKMVLILLTAIFCTTCFAALDLELTQGVDGATPITILPFGGEAQLGGKNLTQIIRNDLQNSGHFRLIDARRAPEQATNASQIDIPKWRNLGVDNIVVGSIADKGNNKLEVTYQLINLYEQKTHQSNPSVLISKSFIMSKDSVRALGHRISNQIFSKLLGKPGVFSTHIAYVLVQKRKHKPTVYKLMVSDIDGANQQALVTSYEPIMSPAWSPDGSKIAYVSFEGHKAAIYVQTVLTGRRSKIADFPGINGAPAWSPDGQSLALVLSKTGYPKIYTLDLATRQLTQITRGWAIDTEPSFTPDGQSIIFTSNRGGGPQIYQVSKNGGSVARITFDGRYNATSSLSKDGKTMVMLHKENGDFHIASQDMTTGQIQILTDSGRNQSPSIAPNGEMVVFATKFGAKQVLGMVSLDAKIRLRIPAGEGDVREPAWSPS